MKTTEMEAQQSQSYLQDLHKSEINCLEQHLSEKNDLINNLLGIKLKREHLLKEKHQVRIQSQLIQFLVIYVLIMLVFLMTI